MGINVLAVAILCAVQTNVVSADSIKTNGVVKIDSSVVFPPMRGDPTRIDALTALISRSDEGKMLTLCVESVKIRKQKIQGSDAKPDEVEVEI